MNFSKVLLNQENSLFLKLCFIVIEKDFSYKLANFMKNAEYYSTSDSLFVEREIYGETRAAVVAGSHSGGLVEIGQKGLVALKAHGGMDLHNG